MPMSNTASMAGEGGQTMEGYQGPPHQSPTLSHSEDIRDISRLVLVHNGWPLFDQSLPGKQAQPKPKPEPKPLPGRARNHRGNREDAYTEHAWDIIWWRRWMKHNYLVGLWWKWDCMRLWGIHQLWERGRLAKQILPYLLGYSPVHSTYDTDNSVIMSGNKGRGGTRLHLSRGDTYTDNKGVTYHNYPHWGCDRILPNI